MDEKRETMEPQFEKDRVENADLPEPEVPDEVEAWALDDVVDILPTAFD